MRFEEADGGWEERRLTQEEASRLLGVCVRTFRRYVDRYEEDGLDGLFDKRMNQVSARRAPTDKVPRTEMLYRECHDGWNVKYFHSHYRREHAGKRSDSGSRPSFSVRALWRRPRDAASIAVAATDRRFGG